MPLTSTSLIQRPKLTQRQVPTMLEKYAQEISEYMSGMMGRSIIITDTKGIIIGAPAKERLGTFHPPSIPCVKYKKISFDDEEAARRIGVWYPGSTVPLFFHGQVVGTAAIAGEPEVVLQFSTLVKNQIESLLREKILSPYLHSQQRDMTELVRDISRFDPARDDHTTLPEKAERLGINLAIPRIAAAIFFSNFRGLGLSNNPVRLSYESGTDPLSDEINYSTTRSRITEILREIFPDPQDIIASISKDRFMVLSVMEHCEDTAADSVVTRVRELCEEASGKLKNASIETIIGIGHPAANLYELPLSCSNAWEVVFIAEKLTMKPGVYCFSDMLLKHMLLSIRSPHALLYVDKNFGEQGDSDELLRTFLIYCDSFFNKQKAAETMHLHRNTLAYRLGKIEERFGISLENFEQVVTLYLSIMVKKLDKTREDLSDWRSR